MDKKVLIQNVISAISSIIMSKEDRELLINVFCGIASELESAASDVSSVEATANEAKSTADTAKTTVDSHTTKITALEGKTKPATTSVAGIVKQVANIPKLAGTEEAADICTKVNAILDGLKTATIMA